MAAATHADARWARALQEHQASVSVLIDAIAAVPDARWMEPVAEGKWSPAQIAEHLALSYEAALNELAGNGHMVLKLTPMRRRLLRWILLPHILFHRTLPIAARAPREVRPPETEATRQELSERLRHLSQRFDDAIVKAERRDTGLTHPYFGPIPPLRALRFITVHLEHHTRQLTPARARG